MTSYVVHFSEGVEIPDLSTNQALAEVAHIQSRFKDGYLSLARSMMSTFVS